MAATHVPFVANLPTEEVYTLPKRDGVTGRVVASKPLVYQGSLIEHFWLEFEGGRVVRFHAEKGEERDYGNWAFNKRDIIASF